MGWATRHSIGPDDPAYVSVEKHTQLELLRRAEYDARPDVIAKRREDGEARARMELERNGKRKRPKLIQTTDYPWLKPDWVEAPVRPFKR